MQSHRRTLTVQSGAGSWTSEWISVGAAGFRVASVTTAWGAAADTAGALSFEGTDDPSYGSAVPLTVASSHGTWPNVGASASAGMVVLSNCPGYIRVKYARSGGGAADQFKVHVTLTE